MIIQIILEHSNLKNILSPFQNKYLILSIHTNHEILINKQKKIQAAESS